MFLCCLLWIGIGIACDTPSGGGYTEPPKTDAPANPIPPGGGGSRSWIVTNTAEWEAALEAIYKDEKNDQFTITVQGDVPVPGDSEFHYADIRGKTYKCTITLNGNGRLYLKSRGAILSITGGWSNTGTTDVTLIIDSPDLILEGLKNGQNGMSEDNSGPVLSIQGTGELRNGTIRGNKYTNGGWGGGVNVGENTWTGSTFTMTGGTIHGNESTDGGGVHVYGATFTMRGGTIRDNEAGTGGGVHVYGGTFTMEDGIISGNKAGGYGGGVAVNKSTTITGGTITMTGGTIRDNEASFGGGVSMDDNCTFTMTGGTIRDNKATSYNGGGVYVNGSIFTMTDGTISGNETIAGGGGVATWGTTFTMTGGTISGNIAGGFGAIGVGDGGGVDFGSGTFTMQDGTISGNIAGGDGGGVAFGGGTFTMQDGAISGNEASDGGGVYVSGGTFTMRGGTISGNEASDGGGVNVSGGTFAMQNGTISGNTATSYGGGVYVERFDSSTTFTKTGGTIYGDNDATNTPPENTVSTAASGAGHAVYGGTYTYRDSTLNPGDNISTDSLSSPPWDN